MSNILKRITVLLLFVSIGGCKKVDVKTENKLELKFLSEFILPENIMLDGTHVGGLSGIDYYNGIYYLASDDTSIPRFYEATIELNETSISNITINNVIRIQDSLRHFDLESIRYDEKTNQLILTSEGHINTGKDPFVFSSDVFGKIEKHFNIPSAFSSITEKGPRHNGTLEGLCKAVDGIGYWIAMELPIEADGPIPELTETKSPVRITYLDAITNAPKKQFAYYLDPIAKKPLGDFAVNGLTDILEYDKGKFLIIERSFSSGLGNQGNTVKIFAADASGATNTLALSSLLENDYITASKNLLFDFEDYREMLTNNSIDNIEGITFGPILPNGNKSLIMVADNNFNKLGAQLNQFILLEILD